MPAGGRVGRASAAVPLPSMPIAFISSKGPSSHPKPHRMTRSTSSGEWAISGVTFAVYSSVGASVSRRSWPALSLLLNSVRTRSRVSVIDAAASSEPIRGDLRGRYSSVAGSSVRISDSPPPFFTRL